MSKTKNTKFKWRKLLFAATAAATSLVAPAAEVLAWDTNIPDELIINSVPIKSSNSDSLLSELHKIFLSSK